MQITDKKREIGRCLICSKDLPLDGDYCDECKEELELKKELKRNDNAENRIEPKREGNI